MSKTANQISVSGEMINLHKCDNCECILDGPGYYYWQDKDFTLCLLCIVDLARKTRC